MEGGAVSLFIESHWVAQPSRLAVAAVVLPGLVLLIDVDCTRLQDAGKTYSKLTMFFSVLHVAV